MSWSTPLSFFPKLINPLPVYFPFLWTWCTKEKSLFKPCIVPAALPSHPWSLHSAEMASSPYAGTPCADGVLDSGGPRAITASPQRLGRTNNFVGSPANHRGSQQRSFLFQSSLSLRVARRLCRDAVRHRRLTRGPFRPNNIDGGRFVEQCESYRFVGYC